jgi:hypothetical protein
MSQKYTREMVQISEAMQKRWAFDGKVWYTMEEIFGTLKKYSHSSMTFPMMVKVVNEMVHAEHKLNQLVKKDRMYRLPVYV